MAGLDEIVDYCQKRLNVDRIRDFKGSCNGLQVANDGRVRRIAAVVDAGLVPFLEANRIGADLVLCHHGMFWTPPLPVVGPAREKLKVLLENNMALYSCHLPLDAHQEIGNNACIVRELGLEVERWGLEYEGVPMSPVCGYGRPRAALLEKLQTVFPRVTSMEFGSESPERICVVSGSGNLTLTELRSLGVDTIVTGEVKQSCFNTAQEYGLNVYACGHYETETFGVKALAAELSAKFSVPWSFIPTGCPL